MIPVQEAYIMKQQSGITDNERAAARKNDREAHHELNMLRKLPHNMECFDCTAKMPGWAVLPWGIHVCMDCAQVHPHLGRHLSQTKAINTGTYLWYPHELEVMRQIGNRVAGNFFHRAPPKPQAEDPASVKHQYARDKYERKLWGPNVDYSEDLSEALFPSGSTAKSSALQNQKEDVQPSEDLIQFTDPEPLLRDSTAFDQNSGPRTCQPSSDARMPLSKQREGVDFFSLYGVA